MAYNYFNGLFDLGNNKNNDLSCIYQNLSDLKSIQGGSYKKLLTAYYNETKEDKKSDRVSKTEDTADTKEMTSIKKCTDQLSESAKALLEKGKASFYEEGKEAECLSAVKEFVKDYNTLVDCVDDTEEKSITRKFNAMLSNTKAYAGSLERIGIKVEDSGQLKVDEAKFKSSDMQEVKKLFGNSSSFGATTWQFASKIGSAAQSVVNGVGVYSSKGDYSYMNLNSYYDTYL